MSRNSPWARSGRSTFSTPSAASTATENALMKKIIDGARKNFVPGTSAYTMW